MTLNIAERDGTVTPETVRSPASTLQAMEAVTGYMVLIIFTVSLELT
jgi:hypothetical protein